MPNTNISKKGKDSCSFDKTVCVCNDFIRCTTKRLVEGEIVVTEITIEPHNINHLEKRS